MFLSTDATLLIRTFYSGQKRWLFKIPWDCVHCGLAVGLVNSEQILQINFHIYQTLRNTTFIRSHYNIAEKLLYGKLKQNNHSLTLHFAKEHFFLIRPKKNICVFTVTCQKNQGSVGIKFFISYFFYRQNRK